MSELLQSHRICTSITEATLLEGTTMRRLFNSLLIAILATLALPVTASSDFQRDLELGVGRVVGVDEDGVVLGADGGRGGEGGGQAGGVRGGGSHQDNILRYYPRHNGWPNGCSFFSLKGTTIRPTIVLMIVMQSLF